MQRLLSCKLVSVLAGRAAISRPLNAFTSPARPTHPWQSLSPRSLGFFSKKPSQASANGVFVGRGLAGLRCSSFDEDSLINSALWNRKLYLANQSKKVVWGLITINIGVFLLWQVLDSEFMMNNFTSSVENFIGGRLHTFITSVFSHTHLGHIIHNMIGLYFFGIYLGAGIGADMVLMTYIGAGIFGYLLHTISCLPKDRNLEEVSTTLALGASGAVNAIILLGLSLYPKGTFFFNGQPVPAVLLGSYLIGKHILETLEGDTPVSVLLGGAAIAATTWAAV